MLKKDNFRVETLREVKRAFYGENKRGLIYKNSFIKQIEGNEEPVSKQETVPDGDEPEVGEPEV